MVTVDSPTANENQMIKRLQALVSASITISSELDLDTVLQTIADTARNFAGAQYAALGIVGEDELIISFITSGISKTEREEIGEPPRGHGLLGVLIKQGQPLRVRNMSKDARRSGFPPNHPPMTSLLGVPVSINNKIVGDLYITDRINADEFTAEDEWWLTLFARQAAVAVQNARLYKKMKLARERAQTLAELAGALNEAIKPEELFDQITLAACRLLEVPAAALYLLDTNQTRFDLQAQTGLQSSINGELHTCLPLQGSLAGQVLVKATSINIENSAELSNVFFPPLQNNQIAASVLVSPIKHGGKVNGVIEVHSDQRRKFSPEEISLLEAFAGYAALALEKIQLHRQREDFLSMTAHDLRAPLTAIKMSAGLLAANLTDQLPPPLARLVSNIDRNSERLNNLLNDLLELTRLEQGRVQLKLAKLEIGEAVAATAHTLMPLFEEKNQKLSLEQPDAEGWVMADRRRLEQALVNILTNANKYTPSSGQIWVSTRIEENRVIVAVKDSGQGIPAEDQSRVFDRYYRRAIHEQSDEIAGSGLGLSITRHLVELHGGQLWVESEVGQGSTFLIQLPLNSAK